MVNKVNKEDYFSTAQIKQIHKSKYDHLTDEEECWVIAEDYEDLLNEYEQLNYEIGCLKSRLQAKETLIKEIEKKYQELKDICNRTDDEKEKEIDKLRFQLFIKEAYHK